MKVKYLFTLLLISLFAETILSQTVVKGIVKDKSNKYIEVNIIAFDTVTNTIGAYSTANNFGYYELYLKQNKHYELRVSYLGYETVNIPIFTGNKKIITKNIVLVSKEYSIEKVEITYTQPIKINGDTITYDANSFSTGNEKRLEDVLGNLPGVEVSKSGEITVKGKKVSKIMVDNKDFFSGDTKLATQNIPANVVDKIQVLNNYSEVGMMKGVNAINNNPVINIKLKQGKKRFWFGNIEVGAGYENKYLLNPKLFYYSPKTSINFIGNINNTGKQSFNFQDYIRFSGGITNLLNGSNGSFSFNSEELGFMLLPNNRAMKINPKFSALNINHIFSKRLLISSFAIFNIDNFEMKKNTKKDYFLNLNSENTNSLSKIISQFALYNFRINYQPNYKIYLDYNLYGKYNDSEFLNNIYSSVSGETETRKNSNINDLKQNFNLFYSVGNKGILSISLKHKFFDNNLSNFYNSRNKVFNFHEFDEINKLHFSQIKDISGNEFRGKTEFIYLLNKQNNIRVNIGSDYVHNILLLNTKQFTSGNEVLLSEKSNFSNELNKKLRYYYSSLKYKALKGNLTASGGIKLHYFISENQQKGGIYLDKQTKITPDIFLKYNFMKTKNISFSYNASPNFMEITKLSEAYVFASYNSLNFGNANLKSSLYHKFSLNYMFFNNFSFSNTHWFINYLRQINPTAISTKLSENLFISKYEQFSKAKETLSSNFNYEKRIKKFKVSFKNILTYSTYENKINDEFARNKLFSHKYKLGVSTFFKNVANFEIGSNQNFTNFKQNNVKSDFINSDYFANIEIPFLKQFIFTADYTYNTNRKIQNKSKKFYSFLNADLYYKAKNKSWGFSISGENILNTKLLTKINNNDIFYYKSDYYTQGISVLFSIVYRI